MLSAILFGLGVVAVVFKRNIITIFMSIELMLNAVNLAFVAFARAHNQLDGSCFRLLRDCGCRGGSGGGPRDRDHDRAEPTVAQRRTREPAQVLMSILDHLWIILALPACRRGDQRPIRQRWPQSAVNTVAVGSVSLAFLAVAELVREFSQLPAGPDSLRGDYFTWMIAGPFRVDFSLQVDQLTVVMLLVVSFVGMLIHIYSTGYMAHEGGYYRFFSYLNLFMFFMLTLVMGANLIVMFVGWEGVGLCSYLLIGFWFLKKSAADAGKKAFIVTRIGDFGFTVGILLVFCDIRLGEFRRHFQQGLAACRWKAPAESAS